MYKLEFPKNPLLQKYSGNNATVGSNNEVSLSDEDVVEDDKVVLETYEDDDDWTLEKLALNLAFVIWNKFLQRMIYP